MARNLIDRVVDICFGPTILMEMQRLYSIGEASDLIGVSVQMLRIYEREGLILPLRKTSKHRLYSEEDIERLRCIRSTIKEEKVSIAGLRSMLALIPCWGIRNCPEESRRDCPAFFEHTTPCWTVAGKPWECASAECRGCTVYVNNAGCGNIKQTIASFTSAASREANQ